MRCDIDAIFRSFVLELPAALRGVAEELPHVLSLAPAGTPWSEVFGHEITLRAPALVADAMPVVSSGLVQAAVAAHFFAVVEAFTTDRIEDGQVEPTPELRELADCLRRARDEALRTVAPGVDDGEIDGALADAVTTNAIQTERQLLQQTSGVDFRTYLTVSTAKQRVGLPASLALAHAAGWEPRRRRVLRAMLEDVWVALQLQDDVADWEEDGLRGGSWAVALAWREQLSRPARERETMPPVIRRMVHASGVLSRMLHTAHRRFRAARRRATLLHMPRLAAWAKDREAHLFDLARGEDAAPGYVVRKQALDAWAREVMS